MKETATTSEFHNSQMKFAKWALIYLVPLTLATHVIGLAISVVEGKRHRYGHGNTRVEHTVGAESLPPAKSLQVPLTEMRS